VTAFHPIIPARRPAPFDDPAWLFDLKLDGFRGIADMIRCRMVSKNGNRLHRFESLLDGLPAGYVFDGEIVRLDETGRPIFNELLRPMSGITGVQGSGALFVRSGGVDLIRGCLQCQNPSSRSSF
jgi:ATP-dependent DNA ligase